MKDLNFNSLPISGSFQTFLASFFTGPGLKSHTEFVHLPDGDILTPEVAAREGISDDAPCIFFSPGICGSHTSPYIQRIGLSLFNEGYRVIIANHRGMGQSQKLARGVYHPGSSEDVKSTILHYRTIFPKAPFYVVGFSMGGNLTVKCLGEMSLAERAGIAGFISVVPPLNLLDTIYKFMRPENRFYERYFAYFLFQTIHMRHHYFPDLGPHGMSPSMDLVDLIGNYVAPRAHFKSLSDLCHRSSGKYHLPEITTPGYLIFAGDDPIVSAYELDGVYIPTQIEVLRYSTGGHMGFFGKPPHFFWLDHCVKTLLGKLMGKPTTAR